jgi:hypothetical protein
VKIVEKLSFKKNWIAGIFFSFFIIQLMKIWINFVFSRFKINWTNYFLKNVDFFIK